MYLLYIEKYDILSAWENHRAKAALPSVFCGGINPPDERKEGGAMYVTYADLIQIGIFIVALIGLCYTIFKERKK